MIEQEYAPQSYGINGNDEKATAAHVETLPTPRLEPPELVKAMSPEQRVLAEKKLKRKLDIRLLPMLILMYVFVFPFRFDGSRSLTSDQRYIMNYLDRNNVREFVRPILVCTC